MMIVRRTLKELKENHTNRLLGAYSQIPKLFRPEYRAEDKEFRFPQANGKQSRIVLGYCDNENDVLQYQGQEYDVLFIDEGTQLTEFQFIWLNSMVRGVNEYPKRTYVTCNPGGVGHGWVKRLFIDRDYKRSERKKDYTFVQAKVWDNLPLFLSDAGFQNFIKSERRKHKELTDEYIKSVFHFIDPDIKNDDPLKEILRQAMWEADYVRMLDSLPVDLRKAWLEGNWNVFAGQYFGEYHKETHVRKCPDISGWRKSVAIDYGLDCLAILWFAVSPKGEVINYRDHEAKDLSPSQAARRVRELSGTDRIEEYIAPPDLWSRNRDTGRSTAEIFAESGIPLIKAGNDRIDGWMNVKEYLKGEEPTLTISEDCQHLDRCLPLLQHDRTKVNDVAKDPHDITHSPDALRYWCSRRPIIPTIEREKKPDPFGLGKEESDTYDEGYFMGGYQ
jgi:phage terminase large subunit